MSRFLCLWLSVIAALFVTGCGGGSDLPTGVTVTGTLVKGGAPIVFKAMPEGNGDVTLTLAPADGKSGGDSARAKADGTFEFHGAGTGVAPGLYRLAVIVHPNDANDPDALEGKFNAADSPIKVEVTADKAGKTVDLGTIDLDKPPESLATK